MTRPLLSHVLASYTPDDFNTAPADLELLRALGFRVITFVPSYYIHEFHSGALQLDTSRTPGLKKQQEIFQLALNLGFVLRVTPHLEIAHSSKWRAELRLNPLAPIAPSGLSYESAILTPTLQLMARALHKTPHAHAHAVLTLGSELERSIAQYASKWRQLLLHMQEQRQALACGERIEFCFNFNWDHHARYGANPARDAFIAGLDCASISFYPPVRLPFALTQDRRTAYQHCTAWLRLLQSRLDIGEFGLGSADWRQPYAYDAQAFESDSGEAARQSRRAYWRGMLDFLAAAGNDPAHATIWSVGAYNVLGAYGNYSQRDEWIIDAVMEYNQQGVHLADP